MMIYSDEDRSYLLCLAKGRKCGGANTKEDATKGLIDYFVQLLDEEGEISEL